VAIFLRELWSFRLDQAAFDELRETQAFCFAGVKIHDQDNPVYSRNRSGTESLVPDFCTYTQLFPHLVYGRAGTFALRKGNWAFGSFHAFFAGLCDEESSDTKLASGR